MVHTAFAGTRLIASGDLTTVARATEMAVGRAAHGVLIFDDSTGAPVELDLRQGAEAAVAAYRARTAAPPEAPARLGRGRPKLGVVAREVTLLPRHWDWLTTQPGGASAALRRLVEEARKAGSAADRAREAQQALYRVMSVLAGDLPRYEDAIRALFARDDDGFDAIVETWPEDVGDYVFRLAAAEREARALA